MAERSWLSAAFLLTCLGGGVDPVVDASAAVLALVEDLDCGIDAERRVLGRLPLGVLVREAALDVLDGPAGVFPAGQQSATHLPGLFGERFPVKDLADTHRGGPIF
ncbi:hypothetical protein LY76DRAFT_687232 [Colletotrichum caudatum]|nr:hypothetical protein LY76DRAFT_687232 [Colletotrichum caudatum]